MSFDCVNFTETCPLRTLEACVKDFRNVGLDSNLCTNVELVAFAGDKVKYETELTSIQIGGGKIIVNGTFTIEIGSIATNQTLDSSFLAINGNNYPFASSIPQVITANTKYIVNFICQIPKEKCDAQTKFIVINITWKNPNNSNDLTQRNFQKTFDTSLCDLVSCPCDLDIVLKEEEVILTGPNVPDSANISKEVDVGSVTNTIPSCGDTIESSTQYSIVGIPQSKPYCGPPFATKTVKVNLKVECALPTAEITIINNNDIRDNWSACKEGETTECGIVKYTVELDNEQVITNCPSLKIVTGITKTPTYDKTIKVRVYVKGATENLYENANFTLGNTITINDVNMVSGDVIYVEYKWNRETFDLGLNELTGGEEVTLTINNTVGDVKFQYNTTTTLKDEITGGYIIPPDCSVPEDCDHPIASLKLSNKQGNEHGYYCDALATILNTLTTTGITDFKEYVYVANKVYTHATLVYYVKASPGEPQVRNSFKVENTTKRSECDPDKVIPMTSSNCEVVINV